MEKLRSLEAPVYIKRVPEIEISKSSLKAVILENFPKRKEKFKSLSYTHGYNNVRY